MTQWLGVLLVCAAAAQELPLELTRPRVAAPRAGWELGMISSAASDGKGTIYLLQRGLTAAPVVALAVPVVPEAVVLPVVGRTEPTEPMAPWLFE
jgi:hypothetical protein